MTTSIPAGRLEKFTNFGDLLRFLRRRMGLTQTELSIAVGYSTSQISRLEQNLRLPDIPTIETRFVSALDLEDEPKVMARLLDLAANVRREDAPALGLSPYKGLNYFDEGDADLFVGREALTVQLVERILSLASLQSLDETRFLAVVGASGSGKSSLARAGIIPSLRWNKISTNWHINVLTPTAHPLESLAESMTRENGSVSATATLMDDLAHHSRSLHLFAKRELRPENNSRVLLLIDQFEELFSLCRSEDERTSFINNLLTAASDPDGPVVVVITLRADFYAHCANYPQLREALAQHQEYIGAMTSEELCRTIEEPARRGRWEFEPGLVDMLLHDVGADAGHSPEPGALPLLSHALLETWQRRRGRTMTMSGYVSSGGVRGAIAETAKSVFTDQFTPEQQTIAQRIFLRLTELGDETATGDTRRRATFDELILKPEEASNTQAVIKALADARLIITSENSAEVAHEALIREWPTLRGWLEDNREGLRLHRQLTEAAQEWLSSKREADVLYRGARLIQAREWAESHADEMNALEHEFLNAAVEFSEREASEREAQRLHELETAQKLAQTEKARLEEHIQSANRLRTRNRVITTVGMAAIVLAILAILFSLQSNQNATLAQKNLVSAQTAQAVAEVNYANAENLRLAAQANLVLSQNGNPGTAALLSIRALQNGYSAQADASLIRSLSGLYTRKLFQGHTGGVYAVAFSPDGEYVLSGSQDGTARLWDVHSGQEIRRYVGHTGGVLAVAFSPDGEFMLTAGDDQTARLWDVATGQQLRIFSDSSLGTSSVAFSPDGRSILIQDAKTGEQLRIFSYSRMAKPLAAFSPNGRFILTNSGTRITRLWDAVTGQEIRAFIGHSEEGNVQYADYVSDAAFSPDGMYLLTGNLFNTSGNVDIAARLWDVATGVEIRTFIGYIEPDRVTSVAFSPDGKTVFTGDGNSTGQLWDVEIGKTPIRTFRGHTNMVNDVAFSPDGKYVLTGGQDTTARLWDAQSGQEVRLFLGHDAALHCVAFSPDGQYILTGSEDGTVRLWAAPAALPLFTFTGHTSGITDIAYSPDGKYVLTGSKDHTARLWDVETNLELRTFVGHTRSVRSVAFSPDGKYVLTGSDDQTARLWETETGKELRIFSGHVIGVASVAFSPDGKFVLTTGVGKVTDLRGQTMLWEVGTGKKVRTFEGGPGRSEGSGTLIAFSPDGTKIIVRGFYGDVYLFDTATAQELGRFTHSEPVNSVAFSPDGKYVLTGSNDKTAQIWDAATGQQLHNFTDQTHAVLSVAFSPDSKYILTGLDDNTSHLWDILSGQELRTFTGHTGSVTSVAFSPDGHFVLTGSEDGTARLWGIDYQDTVRFTCSLLWRDFTNEEREQYKITDTTPTCPSP